MVTGLEIFRQHFASYRDQYILIGGTACMIVMDEVGINFRATRDFDIVLRAEALDDKFIMAFWEFVNAGGYQIREKSNGLPILYRFDKPTNKEFPAKLELSSRLVNTKKLEDGKKFRLLKDEEPISLSAILMDNDYYQFVLNGRKNLNGLSLIGCEHLIPLKAKAWLNLKIKKDARGSVDSGDIRKHKYDILRLHQLLVADENLTLPLAIKNDLRKFIQSIENEPVDLKNLGIKNKPYLSALDAIKDYYNIQPLLTLGEALTKSRGDQLAQQVQEILAAGANVNDASLNGHRPLQLLIKANLQPLKKLELAKIFIQLGAEIHAADNSGLTPYQVAISEGDKSISDLLRSIGAYPMSPPGTGYAQHYNMYHEIPLP